MNCSLKFLFSSQLKPVAEDEDTIEGEDVGEVRGIEVEEVVEEVLSNQALWITGQNRF